MKLRRFRRRFGITAPKLVIRNTVPWSWIIGTSLIWLSLLIGSLWMERGRHAESQVLLERIDGLRKELAMLQLQQNTADNVAHIEKATQQQLSQRIAGLEKENAGLKEDIRFFERLIPPAGDEGEVRVDTVQIYRDGGDWRYRSLFSYRPSKNIPIFKGRLQLMSIHKDGSSSPLQALGEESSALEIKHFARREGRIPLSGSGELAAIEFRVYQGDTLRAKISEPIAGEKDVRTKN